MERVKGIEPSYLAWKATALPLSYTRARAVIVAFAGGVKMATAERQHTALGI